MSKRNWLKPRFASDLEQIAKGERPDWMQPRQRPSVAKSKDELRQEAERATAAFKAKHTVTVAPADPERSPTFRRRPWNSFK